MNGSEMILSVTQINEYIRTLLGRDDVLSAICVRGEVSNLTYHRSGHIYFTLKDSGGVLRAVMFRTSAQRLRFALKEGMSVIAYGHITLYAPSGQYQICCEDIQPDGVGALYAEFEQIKERLAARGLFDMSRKKPIPKYPERIGIITSPTGAAIHDMINVLGRRFHPAMLVLYPALVQGEGAYRTLISGLRYFNETHSADVLIIGRGGGSMEDLWAFNSPELAEAIADSEIPVISAVGHESDFTICDFVADLRAPTPSAAAELAVPDGMSLKNELATSLSRMQSVMLSRIILAKEQVKRLENSRVLASREALLDEYRIKISTVSDRLDALVGEKTKDSEHTLGLLTARLESISPLSTLSRGYAMVRTERGEVVSSADALEIGEKIEITLGDGEISAVVEGIRKEDRNAKIRK